jgi:hypothetical protein
LCVRSWVCFGHSKRASGARQGSESGWSSRVSPEPDTTFAEALQPSIKTVKLSGRWTVAEVQGALRETAWKTDPLREWRKDALGGGELDTRADAGRCFPAHAASAGGGDWRPGVARAGPPRYRRASRSGDPGRSCNRWRTGARTADSGADEEPEPRARAPQQPPALSAWTTAARLCEAPAVRLSLGSVLQAAPRNDAKTPAPTGVFVCLAKLGEAYLHPPATHPLRLAAVPPHPPRCARDDDAALLILDLVGQIPTDRPERLQMMA